MRPRVVALRWRSVPFERNGSPVTLDDAWSDRSLAAQLEAIWKTGEVRGEPWLRDYGNAAGNDVNPRVRVSPSYVLRESNGTADGYQWVDARQLLNGMG
jgi:hypothetical protein